MKISRVGMVTAIAIAAALSLTRAAGSDEMHKAAAITADTLTWQEMSAKGSGVMIATVSGDYTQGAWAGFVRFPAGSKSGVHTHSSDLKIVVVSGTFHYGGTPETEKNYGAGSYVFIPANLPHSNSSARGRAALHGAARQVRQQTGEVAGSRSASGTKVTGRTLSRTPIPMGLLPS